LMVTLPFALFISCDKDEPDTSFTGTWLLQAREKRSCTDSADNSKKDSNFIFRTPCTSELRFLCSYEQYIFSETTYSRNTSGTLFAVPYSDSHEGTYSISGSSLTICEERSSGEQDCKVFEYAIDGKTMWLTITDAETGCLKITYYSKQ